MSKLTRLKRYCASRLSCRQPRVQVLVVSSQLLKRWLKPIPHMDACVGYSCLIFITIVKTEGGTPTSMTFEDATPTLIVWSSFVVLNMSRLSPLTLHVYTYG
eukprot:SAG31_NODE_243_length_19342_cov_12.906459_16_plen_102_part_00